MPEPANTDTYKEKNAGLYPKLVGLTEGIILIFSAKKSHVMPGQTLHIELVVNEMRLFFISKYSKQRSKANTQFLKINGTQSQLISRTINKHVLNILFFI